MYGVAKVAPSAGSVEYVRVDDPTPRPDEVVIRVRAALICGTDLSMYDWKPEWAKEYAPTLPVVMGHECVGEIVASGSQARRYRVGDRVAPFPIIYCGTCEFCRAGRPAICLNRPMLGMGAPGVFAEYVAVREENVYPVPEELPWETAAMTELMCVALHAVNRVTFMPGESVYIAGPGPVGLALAVAAIGSGAGQVFVSGLAADAARLDLARELGATPVVVDREDVGVFMGAQTRGRGVDLAFEASGHPNGFEQCMQTVRRGGRIGMVGQGAASATLASNQVSYREVDLFGIRGSTTAVWRRAGAFLVRNERAVNKLVTHRLPLSRGTEGFGMMKGRTGVKVLLQTD